MKVFKRFPLSRTRSSKKAAEHQPVAADDIPRTQTLPAKRSAPVVEPFRPAPVAEEAEESPGTMGPEASGPAAHPPQGGGEVKHPSQVKQMSQEELKQMWRQLDRNGDGRLAKDDLAQVATHEKLTGEEIDEVFKEVDVDKTGTISFEQFKKAMNSASTPKALLVRSRIHRAHAACRRLGGLRARDTHEDGGSSRGALVNVDTILYAPGMESVARDLEKHIGCGRTVCSDRVQPSDLPDYFTREAGVAWDSFPSDDPNIKVRIDAVKDKHVVFLLNCESSESLFRQLNLCIYLQRFLVPHEDAELAKAKWKVELFNKEKRAKGEEEVPHPYAVCRVASLTVVAPWVRACQMERTCRWALSGAGEETKWDNSKKDGEFVDVPTLQTFASLLSGRPAEGSSPSARRILFLDLHEYLDIENGLDTSAAWSNEKRQYLDLTKLHPDAGGPGTPGLDFDAIKPWTSNDVIELREMSRDIFLKLPHYVYQELFFGARDTAHQENEWEEKRRERADAAFEPTGELKPTTQIRELGIDSKWIQSYNIQRGVGTYFASAFAVFLRSHFLPKVRDIEEQGRRAYVIFPDFGAHRRFFRMVRSGGCTLNDQQPCRPEMLPLDQILYLEKKRVGAEIEQSTVLQYKDERGAARDAKPLAIDSHVLIADDFTNSGSTLFGGAKVVRNSTENGKGGTLTVEAYVTHFVAKYEEKTVEGFAQKLYCAVDPKTGARFERTLDGFHCFDTLPTITGQLEKHCAKLKNEGTAHLPTCFMGATVHGIGQLVSEWMQDSGPLLAVASLAEEAHFKALEEVHKLRSQGLATRADHGGKMSDADVERLAKSELADFEKHLREKDRWEAKEVWQSTSWLDTKRGNRGNPLSKALLQPLHNLQKNAEVELGGTEWTEYMSVYRAASSLFFLKSLTHRQTAALMNQMEMVDELATHVTSATTELAGGSRGQEAGTGKFAFELKFGTMFHFNSGLEKLIGAPQPTIYQEMSYEHGFEPVNESDGAQSSLSSYYVAPQMASNPGPYSEILPGQGESKHYAKEVFKTSNYGSFPTSATYEWLWMVGENEQAENWLKAPFSPQTKDLQEAKITRIRELAEELEKRTKGGIISKLPVSIGEVREAEEKALAGNDGMIAKCLTLAGDLLGMLSDEQTGSQRGRRGRTHQDIEKFLKEKNEALKSKQCNDELLYEEVLGACLYTGPMFMQYNKRLRDIVMSLGTNKQQPQPSSSSGDQHYTTTIHVINGAVLKLSKLSKAATVYRGISGGQLPLAFIRENDDGIKGGVEVGFMSTSTERHVAEQYSGAKTDDGKLSIIIEMQQGMVDRGADLSEISQYPAEKEILFPPLTALQVVSRRVHDKALILEVRPTCNTHSLTISEVIGKRAKLLLDMESNMRLEISRDLANTGGTLVSRYELISAAKAAFSELLKCNTDFAAKCAAAKEAPSVSGRALPVDAERQQRVDAARLISSRSKGFLSREQNTRQAGVVQEPAAAAAASGMSNSEDGQRGLRSAEDLAEQLVSLPSTSDNHTARAASVLSSSFPDAPAAAPTCGRKPSLAVGQVVSSGTSLKNVLEPAAAKPADAAVVPSRRRRRRSQPKPADAAVVPNRTWLYMVKEDRMSFNMPGGQGDRLFGEAVRYALDMKVAAVDSVHEFFNALEADDHDDTRLDLSGKCLGRRAFSTMPPGFPAKMLSFTACLAEKRCDAFTMINLQDTGLDDEGGAILVRALQLRKKGASPDSFSGTSPRVSLRGSNSREDLLPNEHSDASWDARMVESGGRCQPVTRLNLMDNPDLTPKLLVQEQGKELKLEDLGIESLVGAELGVDALERYGYLHPSFLAWELKQIIYLLKVRRLDDADHQQLTTVLKKLTFAKAGRTIALAPVVELQFGEALGKALSTCFGKESKLEDVNLSMNHLNDLGLKMLLAQPVQTKSIVRLDLSFNWLGPGCIDALVDGLKNSPLAELLLTGNRLGGDDSKSNGGRLTRLTELSKLEWLGLMLNNVQDVDGKELKEAFTDRVDLRFNRPLLKKQERSRVSYPYAHGSMPSKGPDDQLKAFRPVVVCGSVNMDVNVVVGNLKDHDSKPIDQDHMKWVNNLAADMYLLAPGGKGMNTACAASLLEHELRKEAAPQAQNNVFLSGNVGSDSYGQMLMEEMSRHHVCRDLVGADEEKLTGLANILKVGSGESKILLQNSANDFVTAAQTRDRFSKFDPDALKGGLVCLQLESPVEPNLAALQQAHHFGMNTLLRPNPMPKLEDKMEKGTSGAAAYVGVVRAMLGLTDHVICGSGDIKAIVQWLAREDGELPKRCKEWQKNVDVEKLNNVERSAPSFYAIYKEQLTEDVGNAYALLDAGVSDVTVLIDKAPKGEPDKAKGLPGEQDYSPTRHFGGCVLISRRRVAMPEGLPEEWTKAGGRCTLLRGRDGPDRVLVVEMPTPELSSLDQLYKVGVADGFVGATAAQLAQGIALEDALPLSCALGSMSLLVPMPGADVLCDDGIAAEPVDPWPRPALDHELHSLRLQATGAVSSYVSGVFASDAKEEADKAVVNGDEEDADEEAAKDRVFNVIGQGNKNQRERGEQVGSNALVTRAMRLASLGP